MSHRLSKSTPKDSWCTPRRVVDCLNAFGGINLDPCSNADSIIGAKRIVELPENGFELDWHLFAGTTYVNSPFGAAKITPWIKKAVEEASRGAEIILMSPASVDTKWFRPLWNADAICFIAGRLTFLGAPASATFPVSLAYWGNRRFRFASVFEALGKVVLL